jgi:chorismate dehydratase
VDEGSAERRLLRIGVVGFLNTRPLVEALPHYLPNTLLVVDVPSRLAELLAAGRLDVATVPSIEYARQPGYAIVSDASVACYGPVRSVQVLSRKPIEEIAVLALDDGSRTSAALVQVLLKELYGLQPQLIPLPIGSAPSDVRADAVLLIGDRGMFPPPADFAYTWDLGEAWRQWTGLPFVFSMWVARPGVASPELAERLAAARDDGLKMLDRIAGDAAKQLGLPVADCLRYLSENLRFHLGPHEQQGLLLFYQSAVRHGLLERVPQLSILRGSRHRITSTKL